VDKTTGVRSDNTVILTAGNSVKAYPDQLRRVSYLDVKTRKRFKFLTNNFSLPALTIALIYKSFYTGQSAKDDTRSVRKEYSFFVRN
jgi:hypothetical protein